MRDEKAAKQKASEVKGNLPSALRFLSLFIPHPSSLIPSFLLALLCLAISSSCAPTARNDGSPAPPVEEAKANVNEDEVDAALERAAHAALGERAGTLVVMDAQTGRLRAVVNPRVAFEQAFPPGSAIKPFTALAALRAGLIDAETHELCRTLYTREGFDIACTHPKISTPLDLVHALAYSCNFYFATVGERLSAGVFDTTLASFGFGERTGVNAESESAGSLRRTEPRPGDVLGEGDHLLVTPVQLATAYAALLNGGHLYRPQLASTKNFTPRQIARINVADSHRAILINGMHGATRYGTAMNAGLSHLPAHIYGKTGTSTSSNGFRTQGWFVGILDDAPSVNASDSTGVRLIVLAFLKRAHGSEAAEVARPVFEAYLRSTRSPGAHEGGTGIASDNEEGEDGHDARGSDEETSAARFRVRVTTRSDSTAGVRSTMRSVGLEEYVAGVVAAESSIETELEALKAQSVVSRTFALKNRGRHAAEGFDFCSTTHCQRYVSVAGEDGREQKSSNAAALNRAVAETRGEVLRDGLGQLVDSYFHAACGGMTANIQSLWGVTNAPGYLRGVRDDYCASMPHHHWTESIAAQQLLKALRGDPRSDVGANLTDVVVSRRDTTGRAETITLEGDRRRILRGWDFKLIVGRTLGWNVLKSSRFTVTRAGAGFVFRGGGFGHGLGFCQEGAHVMAERGSTYKQIAGKYFPGTSVSSDALKKSDRAAADGNDVFSSLPLTIESHLAHASFNPPSARVVPQNNGRSMGSEHFRAYYPERTDRREVETVLRMLEAMRASIERRLMLARLTLSGDTSLNVVIHATTSDFIAATGQPGWVAGATRGSRMELQPLALLRRRGVLTTTLRHEYVHFVIEHLGRGKTPRWLAEGLAVHLAGEGAMFARLNSKSKWTRDELERKLVRPSSAEEMRELYAASYNEVRALIRAEGEKNVWRRVAQNSD